MEKLSSNIIIVTGDFLMYNGEKLRYPILDKLFRKNAAGFFNNPIIIL